MLNFGAFVGFILVNLSVIGHFFIRKRMRTGWQWWSHLASPLLGALVCTYVWLSLTNKAKLAGFGWMGVGVIYLAVMTRGFRSAPRRLDI
jgi:amino acid transporter